ncbi:MAG: hypothetical protein ACRDQI_09240 [Pseudonocardiaceae bacterium]
MWTRESTTPGPDRAPNQLPLLQRGHHRRPEDGACVMEYVSVLAGGKFTDHPRCTHPALATLARLVNDWIDDEEARSKLALLAPDLIDTGRGDLRTTHCVVASCLRGASTARQLPPAAERQLTKARRRIGDIKRGGAWAQIRLGCWRLLNPPNVAVSSAFQVAIGQLRGLPRAERNARLSALLRDAVADCRQTVDVHPAGHAGARAS